MTPYLTVQWAWTLSATIVTSMSPNMAAPVSGQYCSHFRLPCSTRLVIITTTPTLCSQTSLQNSDTVPGSGPCRQIKCIN